MCMNERNPGLEHGANIDTQKRPDKLGRQKIAYSFH